jgi:urease accessory protein
VAQCSSKWIESAKVISDKLHQQIASPDFRSAMRNKMRPFRKLSLVAFAVLATVGLPSAALAHIGGHAGGFTNGLAHPFYGLDHVLAMVAVGLWASQLGRPAVWLLPLTFPVVMAAGAVVGWSGVSFPWVEAGIAGSVIALGAAIAFALRPTIALSAVLVGFFALFHGFEHGASLPAHGTALTYGAGFILATLVLHMIGIGVGFAANRVPVRFAARAAGGAIAVIGVALLVTQ